MTDTQDYDETLDALGLLCPLPVLKARKALTSLQSGQVLRLLASDPAAIIDVPHFCQEAGHEFISSSVFDAREIVQGIGDAQVYFIRCK